MSYSLRDLRITFHITLVTKQTVSCISDLGYFFGILNCCIKSLPIERIFFYVVSFGLRAVFRA